MEMAEYIKYFINSETPFMLLFVSLFFYFIKTTRDREIEQNKIIEGRLLSIQKDVQMLIQVWKILLEKELEERK